MSAAVEVSALTVRMRGRTVLDGVSFTASGEVLGIAGRNGSGKTTLLRNIEAASRKRQPGVALLPRAGESRARVGFLPQSFTLPKSLTVEEFVDYAAWVKGVGEARRPVEDAIAAARLQEFARTKLGTASGGVAQRVGFASVLVDSPDILLLDEPTTGVDMHQRDIMREIIATQSRARVTLLSSHITEDLEYLCDRVLVLSQGRPMFLGTVDEARAATGETEFSRALRTLTGGVP